MKQKSHPTHFNILQQVYRIIEDVFMLAASYRYAKLEELRPAIFECLN